MVAGLSIVVENGPKGRPEGPQVFDRVPVLVGRDLGVVGVHIDDPSISRVHASFDIRDDAIWVRDAQSTNGTWVDGERIAAATWVRLAPLSGAQEVRLGIFRLSIRAENLELRSITDTGSRLELATAVAVRAADQGAGAVDGQDPRLAPAVAAVLKWGRARTEAAESLRRALEAAPAGAARAQAAEAMLRSHPEIADDVVLANITRVARGLSAINLGTQDAALAAVQELAAWYLGTEHLPTQPQAVVAFKNKLRAGLDELMLGYVPLASGMSKLTRELALDAGASPDSLRRPTNPATFAKRLLDWRDPSDAPSKTLRQSFSEIIVHQAAMLNGIMRGVQVLLHELAPETIEGVLDRTDNKAGLIGRAFGARERELWDRFKLRYADLADEEQERFRILFGKEFAEEYRQFARETGAPEQRKESGS